MSSSLPTSDTPSVTDDAAREAAALGEDDGDQAATPPPAEAAPAAQAPAKAAPAKAASKPKNQAKKPAKEKPAARPPAAPAAEVSRTAQVSDDDGKTWRPLNSPPVEAAPADQAEDADGDVPAELLPEVRLELCLPGLVAVPEKCYCARHIEVRMKPATARFVRVLAASLETEVQRVSPGKAVEWLLDKLAAAAGPGPKA